MIADLKNNTFFELIQVALGIRVCLSQSPSADEWDCLYEMAKKQSLVGICFAGVRELSSSQTIPPQKLYQKWLGMTAHIQQRNELLTKVGVELIGRLDTDGMEACILKGQSLVPYYKDLAALRQAGDIDIWVKNKNIIELHAYIKGLGYNPKTTIAHVSYEINNRVEIELHASPAFFRNFCTNGKLLKWLNSFNGSNLEFNLVYLLVHIYHHVLFEGIGLRQLMDYYFVLFEANIEGSNSSKDLMVQMVVETLRSFGMLRFTKGVMWIMQEAFGMKREFLLCKPNEKYGRLMLEDMMTGGNFGHHNEKNKGLHDDSAIGRSLRGLRRNMKFFWLGSTEILSSPLWSLWHWCWRKRQRII